MRKLCIVMLLFVGLGSLAGCGTTKKAHTDPALESEVRRLRLKVAELERLSEEEKQKLEEAKDEELSSLEKAKADLEQKLQKQIAEYKTKLEITERGLVITFLNEIFFDSGKDAIKTEGEEVLGQVASVLNADIPDTQVAIEGHTDNDPIKYSGWKSNWELSSARALAVLHYLIDNLSIKPERLSAVGYGEFRPVVSNDTTEGKRQNRRVEIVILPSEIKKIK
ncbi:MAG: OmpA family protein [Candidatus Omnitrophica bacterium]|nr:OmpA family protein [Candidatus Omnitrophota bacterium]